MAEKANGVVEQIGGAEAQQQPVIDISKPKYYLLDMFPYPRLALVMSTEMEHKQACDDSDEDLDVPPGFG
ncbi:hypothetical protein D8674_008621 [Pyrus ussuriensis x Pyrus communis]|uniref:Uncharacterized protein n=1 Tax=Pyrus ussuriensis x Pyrus communis TaxID=2448454 RepID=A0A5N5HY35_9ROSA|nr:hypothetical protein D8674_008621 [Pyrus ussuriensis x Pyrus communis]